jgi:two-component system, LytTR family, sensor histidine kinase AlgZ
VLGAYLLSSPIWRPWDIGSIVFFDGVVCPAISHGLRRRMNEHGWLQGSAARFCLHAVAFVLPTSILLTGAVWLGILLSRGGQVPIAGLLGILAGFTWAFSGWITIYYVVHVRRRRDALQLELAAAAREAQLQALRAQINPHFLFNCLNSLRHLIGSHPERAQAMVTNLAGLLRYSLDSDRRDLVTLREELQIVDEYLELERVRLDERLRVERAIDPAALDARVPPMLVQSLVDNAIKHGIADRVQGGTLRIEAKAGLGGWVVTVSNTGALKAPAAGAGFGLHNARERLRLLFDGAATLTVTDAADVTTAAVRIPRES